MKSKILIVEDNIGDFEFLKNSLKGENCLVMHAPTGHEAFALLERNMPDLIVLDIVLPDIDGFEICKRIRQEGRFEFLPILFFTSSANMDNKLLGLQLGATDFLSKECDPRELILRIKNLLHSKKMFDEMVRLSIIDGLTHVYNRRYFQHRLIDEFERSKRYKHDFCCMIIDIDHFKKINDSRGHPVGDSVIKKIAAILRRNTRGADVLCRYGGDEFGMLLPETNFKGAFVTAERIRRVVEKAEFGDSKSSLSITLSCGISSLVENGAMNMEELLTQADVALYQAKKAGRNRISFYGGK